MVNTKLETDFVERFENYVWEYLRGEPSDTATDKNANYIGKNFNHLSTQILNPLIKEVGIRVHKAVMSEEYGEFVSNKFWNLVEGGILYFHDSTKMFVPYCFAASTSHLVSYGRPYGQLHSVPPKRSDSFIAQVREYVMDLSQEFAGAIAIGDVFVEYAKFTVKEKNFLS